MEVLLYPLNLLLLCVHDPAQTYRFFHHRPPVGVGDIINSAVFCLFSNENFKAERKREREEERETETDKDRDVRELQTQQVTKTDGEREAITRGRRHLSKGRLRIHFFGSFMQPPGFWITEIYLSTLCSVPSMPACTCVISVR